MLNIEKDAIMGFFLDAGADLQTEKLAKQVESFKKENQALKTQLGHAVIIDSDHKTNAMKLKEMLTVVEVLRQLEDKELVFDVTDSEKGSGYISVAVLDAQTRKPVLAVYAEGRDKKERSRRLGWNSLSFYEYLVDKATLAFVKDNVNIKVPKFLLEEFSWKLTDHISTWSETKDKAVSQKLDTVLQKLGA